MLGRLDYFIIIIVIIILLILVLRKFEHYDGSLGTSLHEASGNGSSITNNKIGLKIENISSGTRTYDDKLFDDVVLYESNPADFSDSGVYKCLQNCKGTCLEYGITGNTFCFPNK